MYVPWWKGLRKEIIKECHDSLWVGHPGIECTMVLMERAYYLPHMKKDIELYVKTCLVYQQDKVEQGRILGLLEPPTYTRATLGEYLHGLHHLSPKGGRK